MTDPTPKILLMSFALCAIVVAGATGMRMQTAKRFWHAREVLTSVLAAPATPPDEVSITCRDCVWRELLASLGPVDSLNCYDEVLDEDERGIRCRVFFDGAQCFDADVFGPAGAWRVVTSGHVYLPCLP